MRLYFAGCARDCQKTIVANVQSILSLGDNPWCQELRLYIVENNSTDGTRDIIRKLALSDPRVVPLLLDDIDKLIPFREARIAYCREQLLNTICTDIHKSLYIPVDLDLRLADLFCASSFRSSCELVYSGQCTAIFPTSFPNYYDVHALRAANWCSNSCWKHVQLFNKGSQLSFVLACYWYISRRQKSARSLLAKNLLPVFSAFGGAGIYSLDEVRRVHARYQSPSLADPDAYLCEHVVFNSYFSRLFIKTDWVAPAPEEHIQFWLLNWHQRCWIFIHAALCDLKALVLFFPKRILRSFTCHS
jgi:glycosyltransferase involved in cell wall biosynthesis